MATAAELFDDPTFHTLRPDQQLKAAQMVDKDFAGLPPKDQLMVMNHLWETRAALKQPEGSGIGRFFGSLWDAAAPAFHDISIAFSSDPSALAEKQQLFQNAGKGVVDTARSNLQKANASPSGVAAAGYRAGIVPGIGTIATKAGEQFAGTDPVLDKYGNVVKQGTAPDIAGGSGTAAALIAPSVLKGAGELAESRSISVPVPIRSQLNPVQQRALEYAQDKGLPVDIATASGNPALKGVRKILASQPAAGGVVQAADTANQAAYRAHAGKIAEGIAPDGATTKLEAGVSTGEKLSSSLDNVASRESAAWEELRNRAAQVKETVQTGTKQSSIVDPATNQPAETPVTQTITSPTQMGVVKAVLRPIARRMEATIGEAQRQASPGYNVVQQILNGPDVVDLGTALDNLSAVKNIARSMNELPQVVGMSKGIAKAVVGPLHDAVGSSISDNLGPEGISLWNRARTLTQQKKSIGDMFTARMLADPVGLVRKLTATEDSGVPLLQKIEDTAPAAMPDIARATFEGMLKNSKAGGGLNRIDGALKKWNQLGNETKAKLYGDRAPDIENFMNFVHMASENVNPSNSGAIAGLYATLKNLAHPVTGGLMLMGEKQLARVLTAPNGPQLLMQGLSVPVGGKAISFAKQIQALAAAPRPEQPTAELSPAAAQ